MRRVTEDTTQYGWGEEAKRDRGGRDTDMGQRQSERETETEGY